MGLHKGPSGFHGLEEDMGVARRSQGFIFWRGPLGAPSSFSSHCLPAEQCNAEEVCVMNWYVPMPIKNGSVVMHVDVSSNGLGPFIPNKRCPSPLPGQGVDSGRDFLLPRSLKKTGGDQREGAVSYGRSPLKLEHSPVPAPHLLPGFR